MTLAFPTQLRVGYWGLVAQQNIHPGTIVCDETPLVSVILDTLHSDWSDDDKIRFYADEYKTDTKIIKRALAKVSKDQQDLFRRLVTRSPCWRRDRLDVSRFELYARVLSSAPRDDEGLTCLAVFYKVSYINHSCRPNAVFSWDGERVIVQATNVIAAGEEIVLDRLPESLQCAIAELRKSYLLQKDSFDCQCRDCHLDTCKEGDEIRQRLQHLHAELTGIIGSQMTPTSFQARIQRNTTHLSFASEHCSLIRQLTWQDMRLAGAHVCLAKALHRSGLLSCAQNHATQAMIVSTGINGYVWNNLMIEAMEVLQQCLGLE